MIPLDKQLHFFAGGVLAFTAALFFGPASAFFIATAAGALKEIYDARHPLTHTSDVWDWVATTLGGAFMFVVYLVAGG